MGSLLASPLPRVRFPLPPNFFIWKKIVDVAEINQRHCLEESGQWLENVDQTRLVLASGKLVLQKVESKTSSAFVNCRALRSLVRILLWLFFFLSLGCFHLWSGKTTYFLDNG